MLRDRLWMGAVLIGLVAGVLALDRYLAPWYPCLLLLTILLSQLGCLELVALLRIVPRRTRILCHLGLLTLVLANWLPGSNGWLKLADVFTALLLAGLLTEMAAFHRPNDAITRLSQATWIIAYLGWLPSYLIRLRFLEGDRGTAALALAIFVPKLCDIGAYFTGRLLGKHPMTPILSPKKTWEGAAGGLALAIAGAEGIGYVWEGSLPGPWPLAGIGLALGIAGMLGDLAESMIKRDCLAKDASAIMPGFGGVLDVVDSILFAAPVAYWLLA